MTEQMPEPKGRKAVIGERNVYIPEWNMEQHIDKAKYVMPLIADPLANAAAVGQEEDDEGTYTAAIILGVTKAIAASNLKETIPALIEGVLVENDNGVPKILTLKNAEDEFGFGFYQHLIPLCGEVIKDNLGPLFDGGLQGMFGAM